MLSDLSDSLNLLNSVIPVPFRENSNVLQIVPFENIGNLNIRSYP